MSVLLIDEENPYPRINSGLPTNDFCYSQHDLARVFDEGAKAQLKKVARWGHEFCEHNPENLQAIRAYCPVCWQELLEELK